MSVLVIAEAGVNHNGSLEHALHMVDIAKEASAIVMKFQTFKSEAVVSRTAPKADDQKAAVGSTDSQLEMIKKLELDEGSHRNLIDRCLDRGLRFLSTPFDVKSVDFLVSLGV